MKKMRAIVCFSLLFLAILGSGPGLIAAEGEREPGADPAGLLPLRRVVLFSSGVGYYEHQGVVEGAAGRTFRFLPAQMPDVLKSMVFLDDGAGTVRAVTYDGVESAERALGSYIVDLTANPDLPEILLQLRGREVRVSAAEDVLGSIVSVEKRTIIREEGREELSFLLVLTDGGLKRIALEEVRNITFLDAEVDREFRAALSLLARAGSRERKELDVLLEGDTRRRVRIGYLLESPVWKASYRLVLGEDGGAYLQGWALVDNAGEEDWTDVSLSLVSGRPVSFAMDLYTPVYVERPELEPDYLGGVTPPVYRDALTDSRGVRSAVPEESAQAAPSAKAEQLFRDRAGEAAAADEAFGIGGGVPATAAGREAGELFDYSVARPVTIPRHRSAMIPIVGTNLPGRKLSIYRQADHSRHPYNGVLLRNDSGLHLAPGPLTVFEDGAYAGDARIEHLPPEGERLISYSLDLAVEAAARTDRIPEELHTVRIVRGTLVSEHLQRLRSVYTVRNRRREERTLLIEQPVREGWDLAEDGAADETTGDAYRFYLDLAPGAAVEKIVEERRVVSRSVALSNLDTDRILLFLQAREIDPAVEQALRRVAEMNRGIGETVGERERFEEQVRRIHREQDRIRSNMGSLDRNSDLYRRYVALLAEQEDELRGLNERITELREREGRLVEDRDRFLAGLS